MRLALEWALAAMLFIRSAHVILRCYISVHVWLLCLCTGAALVGCAQIVYNDPSIKWSFELLIFFFVSRPFALFAGSRNGCDWNLMLATNTSTMQSTSVFATCKPLDRFLDATSLTQSDERPYWSSIPRRRHNPYNIFASSAQRCGQKSLIWIRHYKSAVYNRNRIKPVDHSLRNAQQHR